MMKYTISHIRTIHKTQQVITTIETESSEEALELVKANRGLSTIESQVVYKKDTSYLIINEVDLGPTLLDFQ